MVKIDILTYATNYDYVVFERFIGSLNDTGFTGKIYIIIKDTDLKKFDLLKLKYNNIISLLDDLEINKQIHLNTRRFLVMKKYINFLSLSLDSEYLLLCDFRDVLFQKNIENYNYDNNIELYGFLEGVKICHEINCNTPWLKKLECIFDEKFYDNISNEYVICCGTTIGKINSIKQYIYTMCDYISKYNIIDSLDQGIHNYLFYVNKFNGINIKLLSNEDNLVNTVGCDVKKIDENNNIVNKNNEISYIVHQYDRFPIELKKRISDKYGYDFIKHM